MTETVIPTRFAVRRRTAASWTSLNEVLLNAEIGLESDTGKFKYGPGAWNTLPYAMREATLTLSDIVTGNATTSQHGFLKKLDNDPTHYMDGQGNWSVPGGVSGGVWALVGVGQTATGVWDQAVDGSKANVDFTGLAGYGDILIVAHNVTKSVSGQVIATVSVNNGSSFYTASGDYVTPDVNGVLSNATGTAFHATAATAARTGTVRITGANISGTPKFIEQVLATAAAMPRLFVASTSPINAVRVTGSAGGNLTGGKIYCFAR